MTDTIGFSVGAVARRLGVAPSTLRTWNRRYGIGARELSPGRHRRYTAEDITRLEHMQKLILRGAAPADAARAAMAAPVVLAPAPPGAAGSAAGGAASGGRATAVLVPGQAEAGPGANGHDAAAYPGEGSPAPRPGPGHGSGGRRLALPGASAAARGLA
ncbi:MAG: MerR family transcriptional regulator, partial [Streptosporangiaceae bacterium]